MRVGTSIGNHGGDAVEMAKRAVVAEQAGFDTIWFSDHIVNPLAVASPYPYRLGGEVPWSPEDPWFDVIVSMAYCAALTSRIEVAAGVLVLPLREPFALASQLASLDVLSGGRVSLGIGSGWLAEEFTALGADFAARGAIADDYIALLKKLWAGPVEPYESSAVRLSLAVRSEPRPAHQIEILIGGSTRAALYRAGAIGDGWYGLFPTPPSAHELAGLIEIMRQSATEHDRDPSALRIIVSAGRAGTDLDELLSRYVRLGVSDVVVRADLSDVASATDAVEQVHRVRRASS